MTYKGIFERNHFEVSFNSDFCIILSKGEYQYAIYKNMGIRCLNLYSFDDVLLDQLAIHWEVNESKALEEEFDINYSIDKSYLINYLFGLIAYDNTIFSVPNSDYFETDLFIWKEESKLALVLYDKTHNAIQNVLVFSQDYYKLLYPNKNCCLLKDSGQKQVLIAFNPIELLKYIPEIEIGDYATLILPVQTSETFLKSFYENEFERYNFFCSTPEEYLTVLRFLILYINLQGIENIHLERIGERAEISFWCDIEDEILKYIQMAATLQKNLRSTSEQVVSNSFQVKRSTILNRKVVSISFVQSVPELDVLIDFLINSYKIPLNIL